GDSTPRVPLGKDPRPATHQRLLGVAFGDVHRNGKRVRDSVPGGGAVEFVRHRVWCVWRYSRAHEIRLISAQRGDASIEICHRLVARCGVGTEDFLIHDSTHAAFAHRTRGDTTRAGVREGGHSVLHAFDDAEARGVEQGFIVEYRGTGPAQRVDPVLECEIFQESTHRCQLEMRVSVDEPREQHGIAELEIITRRCLVAAPDESNDTILACNDAVFDRWRGYRKHPARAITNQCRTIERTKRAIGRCISAADASCREPVSLEPGPRSPARQWGAACTASIR